MSKCRQYVRRDLRVFNECPTEFDEKERRCKRMEGWLGKDGEERTDDSHNTSRKSEKVSVLAK